VYDAVAKLKPFVMAVDSISSGYTPRDIGQMIPVMDLSLLEAGTHVIGADVTTLWPDSDSPKVNQKNWESITEATIQYDSDFSPSADWSLINDTVRREFAIEESVVSAALAALTARILWRANESRKAKHKQHVFTRRDFLKLAGGVAAGGVVTALNYGREEAFFYGMRQTQVTDGTPSLLQSLVRATKPILMAPDNWGNILC